VWSVLIRVHLWLLLRLQFFAVLCALASLRETLPVAAAQIDKPRRRR
jgi:hypothetical protein